MEFHEILRQRRMVRNYLPDPVPGDVLERIVATIRRAPSGGFSQGQRLVVVTDTDTRAAIARLAGEEQSVADGFEPWISHAPAHVVVWTREEDYHERYRKPDKLDEGEEIAWPAPYWYVDAGAAAMTLMLAAIDEGLDTAIFGVSDLPALRETLGLPDDLRFVAVVAMGHPAEGADAPSSGASVFARRRKAREEVVRWERWG